MENENERLTGLSWASIEQNVAMHTSVPMDLCSTLHVIKLANQIQGLSSYICHMGQSKRTNRKGDSLDPLLIFY